MKIAVATDDGITIGQNFGLAPWYMVFTVEDHKLTGKEKRPKIVYDSNAAPEGPKPAHGDPHGFDPSAQKKYAGMAATVSDCQVVIAGGMAIGAYETIRSYRMEPIVTDVVNIDQAASLYIRGRLPSLRNRLC